MVNASSTAVGAAGPQPALPVDAGDLAPEQVESRLRWARQQGHPRYLWPEVPIVGWRAALREIERVTAAVLGGAEKRPRLEPDGEAGLKALGVAAFTSGMGPLLGHWTESGRLEASGAAAALLRLHLEHGRLRARRLEGELARVLEVLGGAGVHATVIKGTHTAREYFPDPGTRPTGDIDLVVTPAEVEAAAKALAAGGYTFVPETLNLRPAKSDWIPPDAPRSLRSLELTHTDNPYAIDLHSSLSWNFLGVRTLELGPLDRQHVSEWEAVQGAALVLKQPHLLAVLAANASHSLRQLPLLHLVELVLVIRQDSPSGRLDWDALESLLRDIDGRRFVYPALALAERLAPGTVGSAFLQRLAAAATPRMRLMLERLEPHAVQRLETTSLGQAFMWTSGVSERLRLVSHMIWPSGLSHRKRRQFWRDRLSRLLGGRVRW